MKETATEHDATVWLEREVPSRMVYRGRRWTVTDTPTRLRESIWSAPVGRVTGLYGWRFQATDDAGESIVFDVYRAENAWHVHHLYA